MPDEPNRKMDGMLRAYAEERRKAPELPLHSATRQMLQGEVTRIYPRGTRRSWAERIKAFWPQWAFASGLCLVVGVTLLSLRLRPGAPPETGRQEVTLSKKASGAPEATVERQESLMPPAPVQERSMPQAPPEVAPAMVPPPPGEQIAARKRIVSTDAPRPEGDLGFPVSAPALEGIVSAAPNPVVLTTKDASSAPLDLSSAAEKARAASPPSSFGREARESAISKAKVEDSTQVAAAAVLAPAFAGPPPISQEALARASGLTNLGAARRVRFVQQSTTHPVRVEAPAATPVLTSFHLEQLGKNVRLLDRDGSIYLGAFEPLSNAPALPAAGAPFNQPPASARPPQSAAYNLVAHGTNQTLGLDVLLTGVYFEKTNEPRSSIDTFSIAHKNPQATRGPQAGPRHLIVGKAVIGSTNSVSFRAVSQDP